MGPSPFADLFVVLRLVFLGLAQHPTTSPCQIVSNTIAPCRGQNLLRVPRDLPRTLEKLDLSYNKIEHIGPADFSSLTQLKELNLGYNHIFSIANDSFASNILLEKLSLFNNSLGEIPSLALKPLKKLTALSISNNIYHLSRLDGVFSSLKNLEEFSLGGPVIYKVGREDFVPLKDIPLKKFSLKTASSLMEYQQGAFSKLSTREFWCDIALDKNPEILRLMLRDLKGKQLQYLRFRNLFEFTYYTDSVDLFAGLPEVEVEELVFYRGKFNEHLLRLVLLNVQKSHVRDLSFIAIDFARSPKQKTPEAGIANLTLRHLLLKDISNPDILRFDWTFTWFADVTYLSILNVNFNFVPCDAWGEMRNVVALNVSGNRLLDEYIYNEGCLYQGIMPKLEQFNLSSNELTHLSTVSKLTSSWPRLSKLDLSHNRIGHSKDLPCVWSPSLVWLDLAYNVVTVEIFECLPTRLQFLDLSYSQLESLDMNYFEVAVDLQELWLSGNKIKFIPTKWRCPNLRVLAVDSNSFGVISKGSFVNMPQLTQLKAGNNPYHCICELYSFLQETLKNGKLQIVDWPSGWICYHPEPLRDTAVVAYAPRVTQCDVMVVVAIAVSITAIVVILTMVLCWWFNVPWYLKATFQILHSRYRASRSQPLREFVYHAFISYSCSDAEWVRRELLQRLEASTPPYRVCIHERDFTPGRWIIDNIIENIENSRKIIFVLSRSFVDSDWCNYELYFAHQRAVGLSFEDVVLVVKEAIDPQALPNKFCKLRKMLSKKTYLEWPPEPNRQAFFWVQLTSVLGKAEAIGRNPKEDPVNSAWGTDGLADGSLEMDNAAHADDVPGC
ncbi:toll-like receptor 2 [Python bivittatus]|uniref:Toll-like receptor 2 n=1 Tax=Python bivittatus TaxID=176946 RepID=A0A9F2R5C7_PYTBI|nr:toll-like receptor 2 [Python bivittatus]